MMESKQYLLLTLNVIDSRAGPYIMIDNWYGI